ncbi:hypothetical protein HDU93_007604 [Gonapodya sp. JEL0774]|nr:hypothetical protein HDU93_007604 [Gonapodya sp. JEL0774]
MSQPVGIKVAFGGATRLINNPSSWDELVERIRASHSIPANQQISVTYVDEDGDKITIDTNPEFQELLNYAQRSTGASGARAVRVEVVTVNPEAAQPNKESKDAFIMVVENARQGVEKMTVSDTETAEVGAARIQKEAEAEAEAESARQQAEQAAVQAAQRAEEAAAKAAEAAVRAAQEAAQRAAQQAEAAARRAAEEAEARRRAEEEEAAYQAFLANLQPQVDTVLSLIESAPRSYIPRLIRDLGPSLASRSWGITVEGPLGELLGTSREARGPGHHGHHHGPGGRHFGRWMRRMGDPEADKRWWGVTCDGCSKKEWVGTRWRCQTCNDYDLCDECNVKKQELHDVSHEFVPIAQPDGFWNTVTCDGCGKNGLVERFKCQTCSNYDLCNACHAKAADVHPTHDFTAMGTPAAFDAAALAQIAAVLDFDSSTPERRVKQERIARHLLRKHNGEIQRVIEDMLKGRKWAKCERDGTAVSSSSDEAEASGSGAGPSRWGGPHRRGRHHGPPGAHPYGHGHGPWGFPHGMPPMPPVPPMPPMPPMPPAEGAAREGMPPPPWGGPGAFGWWGPFGGAGRDGRGWF